MAAQKVMYMPGDGIPAWPSLTCCISDLSRSALLKAAICPGQLYLRQLFALLPLAPESHHNIRLNLTARADLTWWDFFLQVWNEVALLPSGQPSVHVISDASDSYGCGEFDLSQAGCSTAVV